MAELIDKWEVVSKLITLQNNYTFFKSEWDAERLYREIAKLEIGIAKTQGLEVVRCKDCEYWEYGKDYEAYCNHWAGMLTETEKDDFCSYGERKNNGETD